MYIRANDDAAYMALGVHSVLALGILFQFNFYSVCVGLISSLFVVIYPYIKRIFSMPQLFLGFTFNTGALLGWTAIRGCLDVEWMTPIFLYFGGVFWTLIYDSIYAYQDRKDDIKIGVKSTAVLWNDNGKAWMNACAVAMTFCFCIAGVSADMTTPYYLGLLFGSMHALKQINMTDLNNYTECDKAFKKLKIMGLLLLGGIVASRLQKN